MHMYTDVFTKDLSDLPLKKLTTYPEKYFNHWKYEKNTQIYVYFMNKYDRVYYMKKDADDKSEAAIGQIGKGCQYFEKYKFNPSQMNFGQIKKRLKKIPNEENQKNAETRLAFKLGNEYLVKAFFTSGLRTVRPGTAHVVQTLTVPLLLYLLPKKLKRRFASTEEKVFPSASIHLYDLSILPPNTCNRIPPRTKYVLLSVQKTYFTFDLVPENYDIPFRHRDPVVKRMTKLKECDYLDRPVETPYIEHVLLEPDVGGGEEEEEEQENFLMEQPQQFVFLQPSQQQRDEPMQQRIVSRYFQQDEQMQITQQQPNVFLSLQQQQQQQQPQQGEPIQFQLQPSVFLSLQQPQQQLQLQYEPMPGGDPLQSATVEERNVIHLSVDFAKNYQRLKESNRIDSEPRTKNIPVSYHYQEPPLDLSKTAPAAETEVITIDDNNDNVAAAAATTAAVASLENVTPAEVTMNNVDILQQATDELFNDLEFMQELSQEPIPSFDYDFSELLYV